MERVTRMGNAGASASIALLVALVVALFPAGVGGHDHRRAPFLRTQAITPEVTAQAVIVADVTTGVEVYSANADASLPPASTMKIVTAIVAKSILNLDEDVTIQESDIVDPSVFSNMQLQPGDVVSVDALLHGVLIPSGADAAMALARVAGSRLDPESPTPVKQFVDEMNEWAAGRGMTRSHFSNPVGTDDPQQYASARDLVRAAEALMDDWLLARIVAMETAVIDIGGPNARQVELVNTNQLLGRGDVFGVKTGTEELAGQCLITGFWRGDNQIITVVLGSSDRYADTETAMSAVDGTYRWLALGIGAVSLGASEALAAQGLTFMTRRTVLMTVEQAEAMTWEARIDGSAAGMRRGEVVFDLNGRVVARLSIYSAGSGAVARNAA